MHCMHKIDGHLPISLRGRKTLAATEAIPAGNPNGFRWGKLKIY